MAHESRAHEPSKRTSIQIFLLRRFSCRFAQRMVTRVGTTPTMALAPGLARASPPDSEVDNAPFCHTSCQPEVPMHVAAIETRHPATAREPWSGHGQPLVINEHPLKIASQLLN